MPLVHKEIHPVDPETQSIEEMCHIILTNWETVCEENDYHKDYVDDHQWNQWANFRKEVDNKLIDMSYKSTEDIYAYLCSIQNRIDSSRRVDLHQRYLNQRKKEIESAPSPGLIRRLINRF